MVKANTERSNFKVCYTLYICNLGMPKSLTPAWYSAIASSLVEQRFPISGAFQNWESNENE